MKSEVASDGQYDKMNEVRVGEGKTRDREKDCKETSDGGNIHIIY